jgi:hypothetical protein
MVKKVRSKVQIDAMSLCGSRKGGRRFSAQRQALL